MGDKTLACESGYCGEFQDGDEIYEPMHGCGRPQYFCSDCYEVSASDHPGWLKLAGVWQGGELA